MHMRKILNIQLKIEKPKQHRIKFKWIGSTAAEEEVVE